MENKRIIHLIHADGPGGVETGAKLAKKEFKDNISYEIRFIYNAGDNILVKLKKFLKVTKSLFFVDVTYNFTYFKNFIKENTVDFIYT
jgi:hypothetical protein